LLFSVGKEVTMANAHSSSRQPRWWNESHTSAWEAAREAFRQRWDADGSQSRGVGKAFADAEPALRFGYSARREFKEDWDPELEARLQNEWDTLHDPRPPEEEPRFWDDVRQFVHRGWMGP
jgi:hypothetical protein